MSAIALLMGLLVLSYLGSLLVGGRKVRGLPSGVEYLGLGFAVGPHALGLVERSMILEFEPIVQVALGWLAFVVGLDFGRVDGRRVRALSIGLGVTGAVLTGSLVAFATFAWLERTPIPGVEGTKAIILAAGAGAVTGETARFAVQWVAARWGAKGPVSRLLVDVASADDLAPLVLAGALFALAPSSGLALDLPSVGWFALSVALGALLGTVTALLLRGAEGDALWGALIGTLLLGVGVSMRFGLCTIFVTFAMGIALAAVSPGRRILRRTVGPTESAVLYPMLLLAGARIDLKPFLETPRLVELVALVLVARIVGKLASGVLFRAVSPVVRPAGPLFGLVLLSSGPVSVSVGFVFAMRFPGAVGDTILVAAVASCLLGEIVSTFALKTLLTQLGEIPPARARSSDRPEAAAP